MSRQEIIERLDREFGVCDRHIVRINEALDSLGLDGPMSVEQYVDLSAEQIRCIDQFIFRFAKLQDAMGGKLFRYILEYLDEDVSELPMRDILNKLERFQIVPDAHEWVYIRELRNNVVRDYPMSDNEVVSAVNELISKLNAVLGIYHNLKNIYMG